MKKLKEIPFNHELIGQEGIVVKFRNGEPCQEIFVSKIRISAKKPYCIISFDEDGNFFDNTINGKFYIGSDASDYNLIMYQEIEVKEPKEVFIIETLNGEIVCTVRTIKEAQNIIQNLALTKNFKYKITKFIEVIEEGE